MFQSSSAATGAFSRNVAELFSDLKLVIDNFLFDVAANWEATERKYWYLKKIPVLNHLSQTDIFLPLLQDYQPLLLDGTTGNAF